MSRSFLVLALILCSAGAGVLTHVFRLRAAAATEFSRQAELAREDAARIRAQVVFWHKQKIDAGTNFAAELEQMGLGGNDAAGIAAAAQQAFNLRQMRAGNLLAVGRSVVGELRSVEYQIDADRMLEVLPVGAGYRAEVREIPSKTEVVTVGGQVQDSLFGAVEGAGESPELALRLAQIFGYDLDFYTDTRRGDTFRVVLEKKKYANGEPPAYGRIFAAEYLNGGRAYQAVLFHDAAGRPAYYAADGKSLQKAFLRSPLKYGAPITSHFSYSRLNPVLKFRRPHLGIDYGAPVGTPVQTIGTGRVVFAGSKGEAGNLVQIVHANGYETMYLHLSRMLVHVGEHVEIGKTIGYVGSTGLATGPHLDFRILRRGVYLNFERLGLPPTEPVAKQLWSEFIAVRDQWLPLLKQGAALQVRAQLQSSVSGGPDSSSAKPK
ncbi:MAG: peptidoglycan DD-metalloendopeptidase family protein [Candidatus Acidiferrales bacterium]